MFEQIRSITRKSNASFEKTFLARLRSLQNANDYAKFLGSLHDFYAPVEAMILAHVDETVLPEIYFQKKSHVLLSDIEVLNKKYTLRSPSQLPKISSPSSALGALYVTEGAALGGQIIAKLLNRQLKLENGFNFLQTSGKWSEKSWDALLLYLSKHQETINIPEACHCASQTFESMQHWLSEN